MQLVNSRVINQQIPLDFDFQATTPCELEVIDAMAPYWSELCGNASNRQNRAGLYASASLSLAREQLASFLKIEPERLIFTSGATEANNLALLGHARAKALELGKPGHVITVSTEHNSVIDPIRQLQREGFRLTVINPLPDGLVPIEQFVESFQHDTILVSVMMANNEIGVLQPLAELSKLCSERDVSFHSDAAQAFGQFTFDLNELNIDFLTLSGHKIYGPKGIGALVIRKGVLITPLQWGGGQEQGIRAGTVPIPLVIGLAKAAELAFKDLNSRKNRLEKLRNKLWDGLRERVPDLIINGSLKYRLSHNLNFTVPGVQGHHLHRALQPLLICSSGSACNNGATSHVLKAIGRSKEESDASLRLSIGRHTTLSQVEKAIDLISKVIIDLR
ncbi:cysteine desulfurase family protein [Prochlorococcus sp. MIT 1307]|uniref:cysteine desulfurase family protein n=1 Tax=Prochlorococcus sp. MIT 1307 TaxID=3096219 RepID=UPI002A761A75|nr:cysteine desulfurase family protein [Prochlorococcus sp. MIT 1307]